MFKNVCWSELKVPVILVKFNEKFNFLDRFSKNPQISNLMKILSSGSRIVPADRRTDGQT